MDKSDRTQSDLLRVLVIAGIGLPLLMCLAVGLYGLAVWLV